MLWHLLAQALQHGAQLGHVQAQLALQAGQAGILAGRPHVVHKLGVVAAHLIRTCVTVFRTTLVATSRCQAPQQSRLLVVDALGFWRSTGPLALHELLEGGTAGNAGQPPGAPPA